MLGSKVMGKQKLRTRFSEHQDKNDGGKNEKLSVKACHMRKDVIYYFQRFYFAKYLFCEIE